MPSNEELLVMVNQILNQVQDDSAALRTWRQTEEGQQVIQFIVQVGKYNTTVGQGQDISIGDRLDRKLLEEIRDSLRSQLPPPLEIDWQQVSRSLLNEQIQRLTTNSLTHAEGITYRTEQVYVPLGLVERKRQARRREDVLPEQGSLLYEETEITQRFEHEAFLEQVLQKGQSPRSRGRRIAVIGEPGAGKTTLLQQMARWVAENIERAIAIWVSLADLQERSLEDYLLEQWLPATVQQQGQAEASALVKDALVAQFRAGRVWLLLDGVDEMAVAAGNPLGEMERQVRLGGLLSQARMVLTCRLNLWDGDRHALDTFDVYRTLEFAYPVQVEQFVGQWFGALPEAHAGQAERLCGALRQPGKERLRDLVKNPLRLTLLCFNWYLGEGTLPETKAGLYEQFVADFYEWKREQFSTTAVQRRRLNAALGELAREAINKEETRFRLRQEFVSEFLGEPDEPDSLFRLALKLGWINQVGVDVKNWRKAVYAFFHPTFQEYFAAKRFYDQSDSKNLIRHVGEKHWNEVFLFFVGMLPNPESFLFLLKKHTDMLLAEEQDIQRFLSWASTKANSINSQHENLFNLCNSSAIRSIYLTYDVRFALMIDPIFCQDGNSSVRIPFGILFDLNFYKLVEYLARGNLKAAKSLCHELIHFFLKEKEMSTSLGYIPRIPEREIENILRELVNQSRLEADWFISFREAIIRCRNVGHNWNFDERQTSLLRKYYDTNELLISCVDESYSLEEQIKWKIKNMLLLPIIQS
jgi:predicted NACHT family NTPase